MAAFTSIDRNAIAKIGLLAELPPAVLDQALGCARRREISCGTRIFDQGAVAGRAHALLSGAVRISQFGSDGEGILIRLIGPGEIFGCVPIMTNQLYPADATALMDCVEISWDAAELLALMRQHSGIAIAMVTVIGKRLDEMQQRFRELATQGADRRIARTLLRLLAQVGCDTDAGIRIDLPLRRKDIADIAGTTLHTASRIIAAWERQGLLVSQKPYLTIARPAELRQIAEGISSASEDV